MATTSNYGWTTPDDTALVKDGASAIRSLGTAIDTSLNTALGTKKAGMVLLNTTSFSAVSSQALPLNTFSSTYKNYRIVWRHTQNTSTGILSLRMRASGTNATGTDYFLGGYYGGVTSAITRLNTSSATSWSIIGPTATNTSIVIFDLISPQLTTITTGLLNATTNAYIDHFSNALVHNLTTSYDSLDFITSAGTMTGQVSVYGYNE